MAYNGVFGLCTLLYGAETPLETVQDQQIVAGGVTCRLAFPFLAAYKRSPGITAREAEAGQIGRKPYQGGASVGTNAESMGSVSG